jgi:hypothetical protein
MSRNNAGRDETKSDLDNKNAVRDKLAGTLKSVLTELGR